MIVDAKKISFKIYASFSLKDKRSIIKSIINKISNKYPVSIAEVDAHDMLNNGILGIAIVSNSAAHNTKVLDSVIQYIESNYEIDIISVESYY